MKLTLKRDDCGKACTLGILSVDGVFLCYTLERPLADSGGDSPFCILPDTYKVVITPFPHMHIDAPLLEDKHGRSGIFIHPGNYPRDTAGCILVGTSKAPNFVASTWVAFDSLMGKLKGQKDITLEVLP